MIIEYSRGALTRHKRYYTGIGSIHQVVSLNDVPVTGSGLLVEFNRGAVAQQLRYYTGLGQVHQVVSLRLGALNLNDARLRSLKNQKQLKLIQ